VRTTDYEDEFDTVRSTRQIKGDEEDDYVAGAAAGRDLEGGDDDEEDDNVRRMTKQFAWEEERMEEEFNEAGDKMEPFNLKAERTEGYFDETGNFVWKKEEGGGDPWLASLENEEDLEARIGEAAVARRKK
jgi:CD2 antigen cytoplasmic tail-binding protein 2